MEKLNKYIQEALVNHKIKKREYKYFPKTRKELIKCIKDELKDGNTDLNCINTSEIDNMHQLFNQFNSESCKLTKEQQETLDISEWNTSKVFNMAYMFNECQYINCDISNWNTSNVKYMRSMFRFCEQFNCDLSNWDVSNVENMDWIFSWCKHFNCDLSKWNVSHVKSMDNIFDGSGLEGKEPKWYKK